MIDFKTGDDAKLWLKGRIVVHGNLVADRDRVQGGLATTHMNNCSPRIILTCMSGI